MSNTRSESSILAQGHLSTTFWSPTRPKVLVVACSDGRLQQTLDDFLNNELNILDYDRLFIPGGSGALAPGGYQYLRAGEYRKELLFLIEAHGTEEVILLSHGADDHGPPEAVCAHYLRCMPRASRHEIREQQVEDVHELLQSLHVELHHIRFRGFRAEVGKDKSVRYVQIL